MKVFGLACLAAVNPKLLAVDLILMGNRRPRLMFACFLLGGMGLALTVGLLDVFVLHVDAIQAQGQASAGLDLALGMPLLAIGVLLAAGRLHGRRRHQAPATDGPPKRDGWAQRILREPLLTAAPERTTIATRHFKDWLTSHARQLLAAAALLAGGYMVISGTLRLLG